MTDEEIESLTNLLSSDNNDDRRLCLEILHSSETVTSREFLLIWNEAILKSNENWDTYIDILDIVGRLAWKLKKREMGNILINTIKT